MNIKVDISRRCADNKPKGEAGIQIPDFYLHSGASQTYSLVFEGILFRYQRTKDEGIVHGR